MLKHLEATINPTELSSAWKVVWFGLFVHPFSHMCNIAHINYRLQFTT